MQLFENSGSFDSVFEDIADISQAGQRPRIVPFSARMKPRLILPEETVSVDHGGGYDGSVTWVDSVYVAVNLLGSAI